MGSDGLTSNVCKLAVLEDEKPLALSDFSQRLRRAVRPVRDNVAVSLEHAYRVAHVFGKLQELGGGLYISGQTEVGLLD